MAISKQRTSLFFRLSISVTVFSALFSFLPSFLLVIGALGMVFFLGVQLWQEPQRQLLDYARLLLIVAFVSSYFLDALGLPYQNVGNGATKIALCLFLLIYCKDVVAVLIENMHNAPLLMHRATTVQLSYLLADLATVYIVIASLFKFFNWQIGFVNGNLLLVVGLFTALVSLLASAKELR